MELDGENSIFTCSADIEALKGFFACKSNSDAGETLDVFQERDEFGRNALFASCMLGRCDIIRELLKHGASVNELTVRGYSPLHFAALWGHLDTVKTLVELGANLHAQNFRGERAGEVACRYSKVACAEFLSWAEAKQNLEEYITQTRDAFCDENAEVKLNEEETDLIMISCSVKEDWIQNAKNPSVQDFAEQKEHLENTISSLLAKLTHPSEDPTETREH